MKLIIFGVTAIRELTCFKSLYIWSSKGLNYFEIVCIILMTFIFIGALIRVYDLMTKRKKKD
jgi:hypothetical protein